MEAAIITTYRCTNRCQMCSIWKYPTRKEEEFEPALLEKLPHLSFCNITGGEPFLREDIEDIVKIIKKKARRVVISTNGYLTEKILAVTRAHKTIGVRISLEGFPSTNDELRGMQGGFDHGLRTLLELKKLGLKDIGLGITVSDRNAPDMLELYDLARELGVEFATAAVHNSYYFHKCDNVILRKDEVSRSFEKLVEELLGTWRVKNWYRAYFNYGLIRYVQGKSRLLPCCAGKEVFFLDPWGEVLPCNGMEENYWFESMGNLNEASFEEIWNSEKALRVRRTVQECPKNCWMIGTVGPAIKRAPWNPTKWVTKNKISRIFPFLR